MKWVFPAIVSLALPLSFCLTGQIRKPLLILCVLSLQADYTWLIGNSWFSSSWVGASGPSGPYLSFGTIACILFLTWERLFGPSDPPFRVGRKSVAIPAALMILAAAGTIFYSPEPMRVVYYLQTPVYLYLFFLVGLNASRSRDDLALVVKVLMASLAIQSLVYFAQHALGVGFNLRGELINKGAVRWSVQRHGGTVGGSPAVFASFIIPLLMIAVSRFFFAKDQGLRLRMAVLAGMGTLALLLTYTRAAWIGFVPALFCVMFLAARRGASKPWMMLPITLACVAAAILWPHILLRMTELGPQGSALDARVNLMKMAWQVIETNPVLGVGAGAYPFVFRAYLTPELGRDWVYVVHNVYLLHWAETGLLGLLSLLAFWLLALREGLRASRAADPTTAAIATGWSAGVIALMWEMWWDMELGFQASALVWFLCGVMFAAPRAAAAMTDSARQGLRLRAFNPPAPRLSWQGR